MKFNFEYSYKKYILVNSSVAFLTKTLIILLLQKPTSLQSKHYIKQTLFVYENPQDPSFARS